jgi:hypothetical protein
VQGGTTAAAGKLHLNKTLLFKHILAFSDVQFNKMCLTMVLTKTSIIIEIKNVLENGKSYLE